MDIWPRICLMISTPATIASMTSMAFHGAPGFFWGTRSQFLIHRNKCCGNARECSWLFLLGAMRPSLLEYAMSSDSQPAYKQFLKVLNSLRVEMVKSPQTFSLSRKKGWRNDETYETWSSNMFTSRSLGTRASFGAGAIHQGASSRLRTYWCPRTDFAPACTWTGPEKLELIGKSIMD